MPLVERRTWVTEVEFLLGGEYGEHVSAALPRIVWVWFSRKRDSSESSFWTGHVLVVQR